MFHAFAIRPLLFATSLLFAAASQAQSVQYVESSLDGTTWEYDYTISNTSPTLVFDEVTIYFDVGTSSSLSLAASPANWSPLVIQPDSGIPADGYLDVVSPTGPIANGASVSGFSVDFSYLRAGAPSPQSFELYNSSDFSLVYSGTTTSESVSAIPEPTTRAMLCLGLFALFICRRWRVTAEGHTKSKKY